MAADDIGWMFTWGVTVTAMDGLLPVDVLMCELEAIKPAETKVLLLSSPTGVPLTSETGPALLGENDAPLIAEASA